LSKNPAGLLIDISTTPQKQKEKKSKLGFSLFFFIERFDCVIVITIDVLQNQAVRYCGLESGGGYYIIPVTRCKDIRLIFVNKFHLLWLSCRIAKDRETFGVEQRACYLRAFLIFPPLLPIVFCKHNWLDKRQGYPPRWSL
jgi:hypothetical protein